MVFGSFPFDTSDFLLVTGVAALVVVAVMATVAFLAKRLGRVSVVDVAWGLGFVGVAVSSTILGLVLRRHRRYFFAVGDDEPLRDVNAAYHHFLHQQDLRIWLVVALVTVWGGRLAWHIARRARGGGEDPRYEELMSRGSGGVLRKVLLPQGAAIWFISLPVQVSATADGSLGWVTWLGVVVWAVGFGFETVGDAQLRAFKADPANKGTIMDRGLWAWTRHPNYFGDACLWWGIYLVAADSGWAGAATILSPVLMTYFIYAVTGAKLLEKTMSQRDGWDAYAARTSIFFPLPPKGGARKA
ncbi:MAG: DUF1295 domain-containing protein [Marmoricola sp.]